MIDPLILKSLNINGIEELYDENDYSGYTIEDDIDDYIDADSDNGEYWDAG